jgi:tetratricopeptide (TPR) repeat protein
VALFDRSFRHLPFFEALAGTEEGSAEWRATTAGLVVLRLVDAWFAEGPQVASADAWSTKVAREAVEAMDAGTPARALLLGAVDTLAGPSGRNFSPIAARLAAYGRALHFDAKWRLAADVYETLIEFAHPIDEADIYIDASMQLGFCSRLVGEWERAECAYSKAGDVAMSIGDVVGILRARIADARVSRARGNLPRAQEILDEAIHSARAESLPDVEGLALHERGMVAFDRTDFEASIRFGYEALGKYSGQSSRDRVLGDIATAFMELGVTSAARDAFVVLAATAQEQYTRWTATVNLLEIAARDRVEPAFESYRRQFEGIELPPAIEVELHMALGKGFAIFGRTDRARAAYVHAIELAAKQRLNQMLFSAERSLEQLEQGAAAEEYSKTKEAPAEVADIAVAIHSMRKLAGVGG